MATATWPASLPQDPLLRGYNEVRQSGVVTTQMDQGPPKKRRRFTATLTRFQMDLLLTTSQVSDLETFFEIDLDYGALPFDWTHPRTGNSVEFQFRSPYTVEQAHGNGWYSISMELEVLP